MATLLEDLRARARRLHRAAQRGDSTALTRLEQAPPIRRRHALAAIARELGFRGWPHLVRVLRGTEQDDHGTLLYPPQCSAHWNIWCSSYEEARQIRARTGDYLLAYRRDYLVVDEHYVRTMGLDPDDADWERIGRDWVRPSDPAARDRLCQQLVRAVLPE